MLPSPYVVDGQRDWQTPNSTSIESGRAGQHQPPDVVYTLNPKAVWSDGVPISAADFKYAWEQQRGDPRRIVDRRDQHRRLPRHRVGDRVQRRPHRHGEVQDTLRRLADALRQPAAGPRMEKVGWNPDCSTVTRPSTCRAAPSRSARCRPDDPSRAEPEVVGDARQLKSITVHIASSSDQLAPWMSIGLRAGGAAGRP